MSREQFSNDLSHFYETRTKSKETDLFHRVFNIRITPELKKECVLHFGDISVNPRRVKQVANELSSIFITTFPDAGLIADHDLIFQTLTSMYDIHYYDKTTHFSFARFKAAILYQAEKAQPRNRLDDLKRKLNSLEPDTNEITQKRPGPSLPSNFIRDDEIDSIPELHSLTQAEIDWLNELSTFSVKAELTSLPKIRGTAVKSNSEYPESIRSLLKTTREYELKIGKNDRISNELKHTIRDAISSVARDILLRYQKSI